MNTDFYEIKSWVLAIAVSGLIGFVVYFLKNEHKRQQDAEKKANLNIKEITEMFTNAVISFEKSIAKLDITIKELELKITKEYVTFYEYDKTTNRIDQDIKGIGDRFQREIDKCANRKVCD